MQAHGATTIKRSKLVHLRGPSTSGGTFGWHPSQRPAVFGEPHATRTRPGHQIERVQYGGDTLDCFPTGLHPIGVRAAEVSAAS